MARRLDASGGPIRTVIVAAAVVLMFTMAPQTAVASADSTAKSDGVTGVAVPMNSVSFGTYRIQNRYSAKCLDQFTSGLGPFGNSVGLFTCNSSPSEKWRLISSGDSEYPYLFQNVNTGMCLTAPELNIGDHYFMLNCLFDDATQKFTTQTALSGGTFILYVNDPTGDGDILLDEYFTTCCINGSPVGNFTFTNHPLQRWNFLPA